MLIIPLILSHAFLTPDGYSCEPKIDKGNIVISRQIDSYYDTQNKNIYLCPQILGDTERTKYAYYHEFGHWTFYNFLTREEQNYWGTIKNDANSCVSDYAKTNRLEDFAETFAHVILGKDGYTDSPILTVKNRFVRKIIIRLKAK